MVGYRESGSSVRMVLDNVGGPFGIHMVFPARRFLPTRVLAPDDAVAAHFASRVARCKGWLEGRRP